MVASRTYGEKRWLRKRNGAWRSFRHRWRFGSNQPVDCVVEDCIIEQPGLNNARETTCIIVASSEEHSGDDQGIMAYPEACVIRNCYLNLEYQDHPGAIVCISAPDENRSGQQSLPTDSADQTVFLFNNTTIAGQPVAGALQPPLLSGEIQNRARDLSALVDSALVLSIL